MHQPIAISNIIDITLNLFISNAFNIIPIIASAQITPNIVHASIVDTCIIVTSANGVYEPAISKNIEQWSST